MLSFRFKVLCANAGLSIEAAAKLLHVTPRTIRYWFSGKVTVPYAAYKLVRVLRWFELPGPAWHGWHFHSGKLWTPEGHGFEPQDAAWWSLLVRQARSFHTLYAQNAQLRYLRQAQGKAATGVAGDAAASPEPTGAVVPGPATPVAGRREAPGSNLFISHFPTQPISIGQQPGSVIGRTGKTTLPSYKVNISYRENKGVRL